MKSEKSKVPVDQKLYRLNFEHPCVNAWQRPLTEEGTGVVTARHILLGNLWNAKIPHYAVGNSIGYCQRIEAMINVANMKNADVTFAGARQFLDYIMEDPTMTAYCRAQLLHIFGGDFWDEFNSAVTRESKENMGAKNADDTDTTV